MPVAEPGFRPRAVRAQQGAAVVVSHHDQEAGDSGSSKFGPRRKSTALYNIVLLLFFPFCVSTESTVLHFYIFFFWKQCLENIHNSDLPEASELAKLLSQYEIEGVLWAHDTIAQDVLPQDDEATTEVTVTLPADDSSMYNTDQHPPNITIINIEKTNEPLVRIVFTFFCHIVQTKTHKTLVLCVYRVPLFETTVMRWSSAE